MWVCAAPAAPLLSHYCSWITMELRRTVPLVGNPGNLSLNWSFLMVVVAAKTCHTTGDLGEWLKASLALRYAFYRIAQWRWLVVGPRLRLVSRLGNNNDRGSWPHTKVNLIRIIIVRWWWIASWFFFSFFAHLILAVGLIIAQVSPMWEYLHV